MRHSAVKIMDISTSKFTVVEFNVDDGGCGLLPVYCYFKCNEEIEKHLMNLEEIISAYTGKPRDYLSLYECQVHSLVKWHNR